MVKSGRAGWGGLPAPYQVLESVAMPLWQRGSSLSGRAHNLPLGDRSPDRVNRLTVAGRGALSTTAPIWIPKIWRDHTMRTAAELEALTS